MYYLKFSELFAKWKKLFDTFYLSYLQKNEWERDMKYPEHIFKLVLLYAFIMLETRHLFLIIRNSDTFRLVTLWDFQLCYPLLNMSFVRLKLQNTSISSEKGVFKENVHYYGLLLLTWDIIRDLIFRTSSHRNVY